MNRTWIFVALGAALILAVVVVGIAPRSTRLAAGYTLDEPVVSDHRYIINDAGIKVVGQQVLTYTIGADAIIGTVRRDLGREQVDSFHLDLKTGRVHYGAPDGAPDR